MSSHLKSGTESRYLAIDIINGKPELRVLTKLEFSSDVKSMEKTGLVFPPVETKEAFLSSLKNFLRKSHKHDYILVLGAFADPFHPFIGQGSVTLKLLPDIINIFDGRILLKTNSSLVVLALPILEKIKDRIGIIMQIANSQKEKRIQDFLEQLSLPRPEEIRDAGRTLERFGFVVRVLEFDNSLKDIIADTKDTLETILSKLYKPKQRMLMAS